MKHINKTRFFMQHDHGGSEFSGFYFDECIFDNCRLSVRVKSPQKMSTVRNIELINCKSINSYIGPSIFEEVTLIDFSTNQLAIVWSSFFKHVVFRKKIGKIKINLPTQATGDDRKTRAAFEQARKDFYAKVDWALDISEANFIDFGCRGIPLNLIRRDPENQIIVRKRDLPGLDILRRDLASRYPETFFSLEMFLESPDEEKLIAVPFGRPRSKYLDLQSGVAELRRMGLARA